MRPTADGRALEPEGSRFRLPSVRPHGGLLNMMAGREQHDGRSRTIWWLGASMVRSYIISQHCGFLDFENPWVKMSR